MQICWALLARSRNYLYMLTFGNKPAAVALVAISFVPWLISVPLAIKSWMNSRAGRRSDFWAVFIVHSLSALSVIVWYAVFRNHTQVHAWFMVRYLYLPMALGWSNLLFFPAAATARIETCMPQRKRQGRRRRQNPMVSRLPPG